METAMSVRIKHSLTIAGHRTSISLDPPFWEALKEIAGREGVSLNALVERIDESRAGGGLSAAVRVYVLAYYRARSASG